MGANPDLAGLQQFGARRVMHEAEAAIHAAIVPLLGFLGRHKRDLMTTFLKFDGQVNIVQECAAQVGHSRRKEQHSHYVDVSTRFA